MSFAGIFFVYFVLNFIATSSAVYGGDSGDIVISYFFGSIAHPPGFPLNTLLGFILTRILPVRTFAFSANLVSTLYLSFALGLFYLLLKDLTKNIPASLTAVFILAFAPLFWLYAHIAEVFQLSILLVISSLLLLFRWDSKGGSRLLYLSSFLLGLAAFHHYTNFLLLPGYIFFLVSKRRKLSKIKISPLKLISFFLLGILPHLWTVLSGLIGIPTNWGNPTSIAGFIRILLRSDYGTFTASPELVGFSLSARLVQFSWYFKSSLVDFTAIGLILALIGAFWLFITRKDYFWFLVLAFFFSGPFFAAYAVFPPVETFLQGVSERFFLVSYVFLAVFIAYGLTFIFKHTFLIIGKVCKRKEPLNLLLSGTFLILLVTLGLINFPKADLSNFSVGRTLSEDILRSADPSGIILLQGDTATFNTQYSYYVEKVGINNKLVMTGRLRRLSYRQKLMREYPDIYYPKGFGDQENLDFSIAVEDFINENFPKFKIYSLEKLPISDSYIWVQEGMLLRLYTKAEDPSGEEFAREITKKLGKSTFDLKLFEGHYINFLEDHIRTIYARVFTRNALELASRGQYDLAISYFLLAKKLPPTSSGTLYGLGVAYFEKKECNLAVFEFEELIDLDENYWQAWEGLGKVYKDCYNDKQKGEKFMQKAVEIQEKNKGGSLEDL